MLGNAWGIYGNSYELFGKPSAIHGKLLGNAWGLFLGNSFVRRGPTTGRTDRHACKIPYKTALPVLCPHRFWHDFGGELAPNIEIGAADIKRLCKWLGTKEDNAAFNGLARYVRQRNAARASDPWGALRRPLDVVTGDLKGLYRWVHPVELTPEWDAERVEEYFQTRPLALAARAPASLTLVGQDERSQRPCHDPRQLL